MPVLFRLFIKLHVALVKLTGGKIGGTMRGRKILLLTTVGCKTGVRRTVPVVPFLEGEQPYVMASMAGAPENPAWFRNLESNPNVEVQIDADRWRAHAVVVDAAERERLWSKITAAMPDFAEYQKKTTRVIPVVRLDRTA